MKKIFYSLGTLVILFLIGLGIKESFFVNDTPKKDSDSNMSISVSDDSEFVNAITEAKADYETVTEIVLTSDVTLTSDINIKNGQNIKIVNQVNGVVIGQTDLGHTLTVNSTISIDRQASLSLETNTILGSSGTSNGTIMASDDNNATNTDFNAELAILDSLTINPNASLNTSMFKELDLSGSINLVGGAITGNGTLNVNKEAGIIQTDGTYENTVKFTGEGLFVTTSDTASIDLEHSITEATALGETFTIKDDSNNDVPVTSGTYILTNSNYDLGSLTLTGNLNLFSICDTKINVGASNNITVSNSHSLNIGGISSGSSFYSAGTNQIVIDGGATWEANPSGGNYYFVTSAYEAGMDLAGSSIENYGRSTYSASGNTSTTPTIKVIGNGTTLNLYRGVTLQNRINTQTAGTGENVGGAISLYSESNRVNLNINGASIRYNALTEINNSAGGAGIGAQNGDIHMYYGDISYNTVYSGEGYTSGGTDYDSTDGAGVSLIETSHFTIDAGSVSYNHGNGYYNADGGGIMVRNHSKLYLNGGEVSYNFTYGYGGGICIWESEVEISGGLVYGNRASFGGGIASSAENGASIKLGKNNDTNMVTEIAYNTAFQFNSITSGYGGGISLGNTQYKTNQSITLNDGLIHNNTAVYGGGISNYSTGKANNNKLHLQGGTITDNKASNSNNGDGIYAINSDNEGTNNLIEMSGNIQVSTSNNIVFAGLTGNYETTGSTSNLSISNDNEGWKSWEGTETAPQRIGDFGTLRATSMDMVDGNPDYITFYDDFKEDNYNGYFEITPTKNVRFSFSAKKTSGTDRGHANSINLYRDNVLYQTISITDGAYGLYGDYNVPLYANSTYRFELSQKENDYNVQMHNFTFQEYVVNDITQTPIRVSSKLTATGIVGLISYDGSLYSNNAVLADYATGNAQADKFIIDNTNYRIETSGKQVLIVQNTGNIIAYVKDYEQGFSNLTNAINYIIEDSNLKTATVEIINNVNLQGADFITIPTGYNITITSRSSTSSDSVPPYTLNIPSNITGVTNTTLFTVSSGASLTLDNIIIEGNSTQSAGYLIVENNGTFTLNGNATINNNLGIDGYASAIEIGRGKTTTNIYGSITNNIGDYGAIYLSNSEAVVNVSYGAIITGNTYTGNTNGLENITDADIFIENGTLNLTNFSVQIGTTNFSGQIGTIIKQGSGSIKANNIGNTTPINIKLNGNNYVRNNVVVEVEDNDDYSSKFNLLEPEDYKGYDKLIKEDDGYNIILNRVLTIEISFEDVWQRNGDSYNKITDINDVNISDANFDTLDDLAELRYELELSYDIDYHVGESALFFYIDSTFFQLELTDLANVATRSNYYLNGFVEHALGATTARHFYGMDSFISVQNFTDDTSHIYLGVEWLPEQYTLEFNNGDLSTANQTMTNQTISYSDFKTGSPTIKPNLYFATGFYFKGWKVRIDSDDYVQDNGIDLILANKERITTEILNTILDQTESNTFVLEAVWGSIFGDDDLTHVGTSSQTAFEISSIAGLNALANTVNGIIDKYGENDEYDYYTYIDNSGEGSFEASSYENYYFKLTGDIGSSDDPFTNVIGQVADFDDSYFKSEEAEKPIQDSSVLAGGKVFSGTLDGGSNTININIKDSNNKDFVGLFAYTKDATITNIKIAGSVNGRISVGSLVGLAYGGTYRNIESDADVTFNGINAGGIFGTYYIEKTRYTEGSITNVVNRGNVTYNRTSGDPSATDLAIGATWAENQILYAYQGSRAGGIVGQSWHLTLREAYNSGNISARFGVGGIVGTMISENESTRDDSVVNTAFNSGNIVATSGLLAEYTYNNDGNEIKQVNAYAGGIAGRMYGASTLTNSMNIGEVSATWTGALNNGNYKYTTENPTLGARGVGGILGVTSIAVSGGSLVGGNKTVSNVINTGKVSAWTHVGGIAGILAYSDLSYALNSGIVKATGKTGDSKGGFTYNGNHYNFMGALVGLGVSAAIASTAVFDGDIEYSGYTDSIIQAIGDDIANENNDASFIGYPLNSSSALKLASSHLVCQPNDNKPVGLDSTFFDSGWVWKSYSDEGNSYRYYPQLVSFSTSSSASSIKLKDSTGKTKTVQKLSEDAVRLTTSTDTPIGPDHTVQLILDLQNGTFNDSKIDINDITFTLSKDGTKLVSNEIYYLTHQTINLATIEALMSYESYYFAGWYRDSSFSEEFDGTISSNDETIYAKWEPRAYNINLIGLQQYANAGVELADDKLLTYTIEDTMGSGKTFSLPTIKENKAYSFSHYEITLNGGTFSATSFNIIRQENGQYLLTFYYGSAQEQTSIRTLSQLDFTLICNPINYNIEYSYDNINNEEITVQNPNQPTFNINSTFGLVSPNIPGYDFVGWYLDDILLTDYTIANVVEKLIENGVEGLGDITLVAKYKPQDLELSLNLNGGTFTSASSGQVTIPIAGTNYKFTRNSQGLWTTTLKFGASLGFINQINENHITAPAGRTFSSISYSLDGETEEIPETMPAGGIQLFVIYTKTTYDIEVIIGDAKNITYNINGIANALDDKYKIKVEDNKLLITISYGEDATEVLDAIRGSGKINSNSYHFGGYDAKNGKDTFNYTNVRLPENNDPTITFLWQQDSYTVAIFDSLGNFISQFDTNDKSVSWINGNTIDIGSLKNNIGGLWNGHSVTGYDNSQNFLILKDNSTVYDSTSSTEPEIDITGYTIIRLVLTPKKYNITFNTNDGSGITGGYSLSYNQQIDLDSLPKTTKPVYDFVGWTYNGNLLIDNDIFIPTTSDLNGKSITLTAEYRKATYNISFNITADRYWNGALTKESITFTYGGEEKKLNSNFFDFKGYNFPKEGATYKGESCSAINDSFVEDLADKGLADIRDITIDVTLEIKQISITFYAGEYGKYDFIQADLARGNDAYYLVALDGSPIKSNIGETLRYYVVVVDYYSTANRYLPSNPQRPGYTYSNYSSNNGVLIQDTLENNQTFNANYSADTYTVIYINDNVSTSIEAEYNEVITLPTYTKEGYTFTGFVVQGTNGPLITGTYKVTGDVVLVAQYEGTYNLKISVSDGGLKTSILNVLKDIVTYDLTSWPDDNTFSIDYGTDLSRLNNITSNEKIVSYTKEGSSYQFSSMPAEEITVSATLETKEYIRVTFIVKDNELNEVYKTSYYAYEKEHGRYYLLDTNVSINIKGYTFDNNWRLNNYVYDLNDGFTEDTILTGTASKIDYKLTYEYYDNGILTTKTITVYYGDTIKDVLKDVVNNRPGYKFLYWTYLNGTDVKDDKIENNVVVVPYFENVNYQVKFTYNNAELTDFTRNYSYGAAVTYPTINDLNLDNTANYYNLNYSNGYNLLHNNNDLMTNLDVYFNEGKNDYDITFDNSTYTITIELTKETKEFTLHFINGNLDDVKFKYGDISIIIDLSECEVPQHYNIGGIGVTDVKKVEIKASYTFDDLISLFVDPTLNTTQEVRIIYEATEYKVNYGEYSVSFTVNDTIIDISNLNQYVITNPGQEFVGFKIADNDNLDLLFNNFIRFTDIESLLSKEKTSITLEPQFEAISINVIYNDLIGNYYSIEVDYGTTYRDALAILEALEGYTTPNRQGYTFNGWYEDSYATKSIISTTVFTAKYTIDVYTITYNYGDNKTEEVTVTINNFINDNYQLLTPYILGYTFNSWSISNGETDETTDTTLTFEQLHDLSTDKKLTLTANTTKKEYTLNYEANGGEGSITTPITIYIDSELNLPKLAKIGYTFNGWYNVAGEEVDSIDDIIKDNENTNITIYARYEAIEYTIEFEVNSKYGSLADSSITNNTITLSYDDVYVLTGANAKDGYTFLYWTYNGQNYYEGQKIINLSTDNNGQIVMTAVFSYTVKFYYSTNQASSTTEDIVCAIDNNGNINITLPTNIDTKDYHYFNGWKISSSDDTIYRPGQIYSGRPTAFYADWQAMTYTINYYDGSTLIGSDTYTYGTGKDTLREVPNKVGMTNDGHWYDAKDVKVEFIGATANGNINLYAKYTIQIITTTININNIPDSYLDDFVTDLNNKKNNSGNISITSGTNSVTVVYTSQYGKEPTDLNNLFATSYSYSANGVTYKLHSFVLGNTMSDYTQDISFVTDEIVVTMIYVYGSHSESRNYMLSGDFILLEENLTVLNIKGYQARNGWYQDEDGLTKYTFTNQELTTSLTLYKVYDSIAFYIYYSDGVAELVKYDVNLIAGYSSPSGYQFLGWSRTEKGLVEFEQGDSVNKLVDYLDTNNSVHLYPVTREYKLEINFDANDAQGKMESMIVSYQALNDSLRLPSPGFALSGHNFGNWTYVINSTTKSVYDADFNFNADFITDLQALLSNNDASLTLSAYWTGATYLVTYVGVDLGDELTNYNTYTYSIGLTLPNGDLVEKQGYTFDGWYTTANFSGSSIDTISSTAKGDIVLYAKYTPVKYKVYIEKPDGVSISGNDLLKTDENGNYYIEVEYLEQFEYLPFATMSNNQFSKWVLSTQDSMVITEETIYIWTESIWIIPTFTLEQYTIVINLNGGTYDGSQASIVHNINYGDSILDTIAKYIFDNPTKVGYDFIGWKYNGNLLEDRLTYATGSVEVFAYWEIHNFNITYSNVENATNNNPNTYNILNRVDFKAPTKVGYTFDGWYLDPDYTNEIKDTTNQVSDLVLYAKFTPITYKITLVDGSDTTYLEYTVISNVEFEKPTKEGYTFVGWKYEGNYITSTNGLTGDITVEADWEGLPRTITIQLAEGESYEGDLIINAKYGDLLSKYTFAIPQKTGYTFVKWVLANETDLPAIITDNITIKPQFTETIYNVTLTINNIPTGLSNTIIGEISTKLKTFSFSVEYVESTNSIIVVIEVPYKADISLFNDLISKTPYPIGDIDYTFGDFNITFTSMPSFNISATGEFTTSHIKVFLYVAGESVIIITLNGGTYSLNEDDLDARYEKLGYNLSDWYSDSSYSNIYNFGITENTSKSLYAKWIPNTYSVRFNANGGTGSMNNQTFTYDESQELTANAFVNNGYTFIGWATTFNGAVVYTDQKVVVNLSAQQGDIVDLYAIWSANTYQIVFNANGGTGNMLNQDIKYQETVSLNAQQFSKIGYRFAGWSTTQNGLVEYVDCGDFTQSETNSITLYAKWEAYVYTISFDVNNVKYDGSVAIIQIEYDEYISDIPTLTLAGYRFIGWYDQNDKQVVNGMIYNYTSNITLTAKWEENIYNVIFDMAGGNQVPSQNVAYGGNIDVSNINPERLGYTFLYFEANGIEYYLSGEGKLLLADYIMTSSNITFTAKWEANTYYIEYELNGGSITGTNPKTFVYGSTSLNALLNSLKKPEKEGYTFTNWSVDVTSLPASDITITAQYSINRYLVEFDTVGGNYINPIYVEYHNLVTVPTVNKVGYEFAYFTYNGQRVDLTTFSMPAENIVLVAQYNRLDYQITYNYMYNDLTDTLSYNVEVNQILEVPTRTGYTFGGWYLDSDYEGTAIVSTAGYAESLELYAKWIKNTYQITYVLNGEINNTNPNSYDVENKVLFTSVTKDGYDFAGWYLDVNYTNEIKDTTNQVGDLVLYAKFTPITYKVTLVDGSDTTYLEYTVETLVTFDRLVKDGYTFIGWANAEDEILVNTLGLLGDITLTAIWEVVDYSISYSLDGGTNNSNNLTSYNIENVVEFLAPTKTGYTFGGWFIDNSFTTSITSTEGYARDLLVYAKWILDEPYTITYENVENYDGSTSYTVESNVLFKTPTKAGYKFIGWEYEGNYITSTNGLTGDITVSAVWGVVDYSITYVADGGSHNNVDNYTVEDIITFLAPTKTGYTFSGWYLDSSFTTSITSTEGYAKDLVLYAKYVANTYEMSFVVDDVEMNIPSVQMNYLQVIGNNLPTLTLPYGISFVRWYYVDGNGTIVTITNATLYMWTSDVTIYAEVVDTTYNIVYETNGGINAIANVTTVKAIDIAAQPIVLQDPNRTGYTFVGWYLSADFAGERVYEITSSLLELAENGVIRLYAKYEINKYTVTYQDMDGTILKADNNVSYGSLATTFVPSKDGKIFDNWYYNDAVYDFNTPITQDITLVAKYRIREVSTTVNINDSLVTVVVSTIDGIGLQADARIVITLKEENHVLNPVEELLAAFGIVARLYDIKLVDSNNNPIEPNGEVRVELTLPSKTLENDKTYTLYHIADSLAEYELMDSTIRNGNIEFYTTHFSYYAIVISDKVVSFLWLWILLGVLGVLLLQAIIIIIVKTRKYKITFISRGNIQVKSVKYKKDERVILPKPERLGYIFGGWYIDSKFSQPANIKTMPNQNIMLYAKWYEDPITIGLRVKKNK